MPWFVVRLSADTAPHILLQREPYGTRAAAEEASLEDALLWPQRRVDQAQAPFLVEAEDDRGVLLEWQRQVGGPPSRQTSG